MTQTTKGAFAPNQNTTKDSYTFRQRQIVLKYFREHTTTMYKCEKDTKVSRPNICRYIAEFEKSGPITRLAKNRMPYIGANGALFHSGK